MSTICRSWLKAVNATASRATREVFRGSAVLGDKHSGFTVELRDGTQLYMGRECCRYCAKAEAVTKHNARAERCADCGEPGERTGHMGCQFPQDH